MPPSWLYLLREALLEKVTFVSIAVCLFLPAPLYASDAVDSAYRLCAVIDGTDLGSSPCEVSGWNGTVTAVIDINATEARKICAQVVDLMAEKGFTFPGRQWKFLIKSPYSGDNSIAFCNLPQ